MADHVLAVDRHQRASRDPRGEARDAWYCAFVNPGGRGEAFVLDPDRLLVRPPVTRMPRDGEVAEPMILPLRETT